MTVSVVLRLREQELADGHLIGQAEVVETGEQSAVGSADELVVFLRRAANEKARQLRPGRRAATECRDGSRLRRTSHAKEDQ